jgi:chemotaxis protein methyltransferase CheR
MAGDMAPIDIDAYQGFSAFLRTACGIDLGANKQYLVTTRIRRILVEQGLSNLAELTLLIQQDSQRALRQRVLDAMTTNETFWFRDVYPFEYLAKVLLPDLAKRKSGEKVRIWSAACSSGQEPYSISMVVEECMRGKRIDRGCDAEILATDLSSSVLDVATQGVYDRQSLTRGLSSERAQDFFQQVDTDNWRIKDSVRNRVRFRPLNLQESFFLLGKFDIVFCRNVLIYFANDLKLEILRKLHANLLPGGILFLGASENISGLNDLYEMINCSPGLAYRAKSISATY